MTAPGVAPPGLALEAPEQELVAEEVERFLAALTTPEARQRYGRLREEVAAGELAAETVLALEGLLEIALGSGEVRRVHGPAGERALADLFARTPRGRDLTEALAQANRALAALEGHRLERLAFRPVLPGVHALEVETDRCRLRFEIDREGVRAKDLSLAV